MSAPVILKLVPKNVIAVSHTHWRKPTSHEVYVREARVALRSRREHTLQYHLEAAKVLLQSVTYVLDLQCLDARVPSITKELDI